VWRRTVPPSARAIGPAGDHGDSPSAEPAEAVRVHAACWPSDQDEVWYFIVGNVTEFPGNPRFPSNSPLKQSRNS